MLAIRALEKAYDTPQGPLAVLRGVDLDVATGESLSLMGESGSGKSTLLHLVAGVDSADAGTITLDDTDITALDDADRARLLAQLPDLEYDPHRYGAYARRNLSASEAAILRHAA